MFGLERDDLYFLRRYSLLFLLNSVCDCSKFLSKAAVSEL